MDKAQNVDPQKRHKLKTIGPDRIVTTRCGTTYKPTRDNPAPITSWESEVTAECCMLPGYTYTGTTVTRTTP